MLLKLSTLPEYCRKGPEREKQKPKTIQKSLLQPAFQREKIHLSPSKIFCLKQQNDRHKKTKNP